MDPRLERAIENDDVAELHSLIVEERKLLDGASEDPFPNSPLHIAAAAGKTQVAMEMAILKPSFARQLNPEGYSPLHLALQHGHYRTVRALVTLDTELIRVRGCCGITPLHYVAEKEGDSELELLAEFLFTCKSSIEDLTSRCETAVHVAVKNHNLKAFKVLLGWLKRVYLIGILNWKDEDGNTVLHIAVSEMQPEIIELLIGNIKLNAKNFQDQTALEIFQLNPSGDQNLAKKLQPPSLELSSLSQFLSRELTGHEKLVSDHNIRDESARNVILLVVTLITTATYQAALSPPGGYWGDNSSKPTANSTDVTANSSRIAVEKPHQAGNIIMSGWKLYLFTALNSSVFLVSIGAICVTATPLLPYSWMVYSLTFYIGVVYFATLIIEFPRPDEILGYIITVFFFSLLLYLFATSVLRWRKYNRFLGGIDAPGRCICNFPELKAWK